MKQNYFKKILVVLLYLSSPILFAQQILVQQAKISTGWVKTVTSGENISFPAAAASPSSFDFVIKNTGVANLTISGVQITGANAADFVAGPVGSLTVLPSQSTSFTVTYTATAATIATAQITILNNSPSPTFSFILKGAPFDLYGPVFPPFGTITSDSNGNIGHPGGKNLLISTVSMGTQTTTYWGPQLNASGNFGIKLSLDNGTYINEENLTFIPGESNLAIGKAVWRGSTFIQNAISFTTVPVQIRATLLTKKPDNSVYPMISPATLGLSEQIGALVQFSALSDFLVANYLIEASTNGVTWTPYLTFYDAYPTPPGPLPGQGIGNAYSTVSNGFYWVNFAPKITQNQILQANEGGSATITTAFLNGSDNEDMPANPSAMVFTFQSSNPGTNPLVFGTGVLKKNGVVMVETDTFTLSDIQSGLITYEHSGSETVYDEFQFSLVDSKGKLAQDGPNSVFSFKINITAVNDTPVTGNLVFTGSYSVPVTGTLTATDADSTTFTYEIVTAPASGNITSFNAATGAFIYTSSTNLPGTDTFTFRVSDGTSLSNISTATLNLIDLPPTASNSSFTTLEDIDYTGTLTATDPEGGAVSFYTAMGPAHGMVTNPLNGSFTYTPDTSYFGPDTFTYTVSDAQGNFSATITVNIIVRPRLDPGDVIAVDENLLRLYDPATSQQIVLTQGQGMTESINTAYKLNVGLFVMDKNTGLINVDPYTGVQSLVLGAGNFSMTGPIGAPPGMLIDNQGQIVIAQSTGIIKVDPVTAVITPLFSGGLLTYPTGMVYLDSGDMIVSDAGLITGGTSRILRITPAGVQSVVSTGGNILLPLDLGLIDQNTIVVADGASFAGGTDKLYKIDLATGVQTVLATGGNISIPSGIDVFQDTAYVVNKEGTSLVIGVDTTTGTQTVLNGPSLSNPWGLIVIPESIVFDNITVTNVSCLAATDGQAVLTFSGGVGPYSYTMNSTTVNNVTSPITISNLAAGTYNIILTDNEGATATTSVIVSTLPDTTAPTITAPIAVTVPADSGSCQTATVALGTPVFSDNCPGTTVANNAPATFPIGLTTVIWTATDASGNPATAAQTVTVEDTQNPTITAPVAVTVTADSGSCNATAVALGTPVFSDNCTGTTVANDAPVTFQTGITTVTWTATDAAGNTATATQTVTVQDNQNPTITAPVAITVPADVAACTASAVVLGTPIFADNCTGATVANDAPAIFPIGLTTVTWTATDAAGNTATATQTVTVEDTQNPVITAPVAITVPADLAACTATAVVLGSPIFSDNCTGATVANDAPATFPIGITNVTWTATDAAGNTSTATQTVTVEDTQNPVITAPVAITQSADAGACEAATVALGTPVFSDNCTGTTVANNAPATFPVGTTTVTWTATDAAGNTATATQTVTIEDNENPVITAPVAITVPVDSGNCEATSVVLGIPIFSDNCTGATVANNAPATFPIGLTTVTWTATDAAGNTATATQTVTVEDNENPVITIPAPMTVSTDATSCEATGVVLATPVFSDNCTGATIANDAPASFPLGITTITWTVTDAAGNTNTTTQQITVEDNQNPIVTAPSAITVPTDAATCEATGVILGTPVFSDNCVGVTITNNAPAIFPQGITNVTWTATDAAGNTATAIQTVTVQDVQNPLITAPAAITVPATAGACYAANVNLGTPIVSDNCTNFTVTNNAPAQFPIGITTVTWTVTDVAGNTATATQTVTVNDTQNPSITVPANVITSTDADSCVATGVILGLPTVIDNCTNFNVTNNAPVTYPLGATIVTWTITDQAGNSDTGYQVVSVMDTHAPLVTNLNPITVPANPNSCEATNVNLGSPVFTDNCMLDTVTNNAPVIFPGGVTTVTWTATDEEGNVATFAQTVTVIDNQNPIITAPAAITTAGNQNCQYVGLDLGEPVVSDNCPDYVVTNNAPAAFPLGQTTVIWTVTDISGNIATATQLVTITMPAAPIANAEQQFCFGATIASLTAETDNVVWYDAETDGTLLTAETVLTNDTTYYAATLISGCESETRLPVHVTIITTPTPAGSTLQEFCNEAFVADFVTTSENVVWYATEDGTTPLEATVQLLDGITYYGSIIDPITGCESPVRLAVTVMIHVGPEAIGRTEYQFCSENFPTLAQLSVNYAAGNWYADAEGEELLDATTLLADETIYYYKMFDTVTGCESPVALEVLVDLIGCNVDSYNFLTPDNNDKNEFLAFKDLEYYPDNMLQIFDRQGKMVFQTIKYGQNNNYFTGEVDNKALPTGTYYYVLEYFSPVTEKQEVKKGFLYINNNE
jgi:gliding motility-associated-like protein